MSVSHLELFTASAGTQRKPGSHRKYSCAAKMMTRTHREWRAEGGGTCGKEGVLGEGSKPVVFFLRRSVLVQIIVEELMA